MIKDTFEFVNKVSGLDANVDKFMFSLDVESLFTNIPIVEIILDRAYMDDAEFFHGFNRKEMKYLLTLCTQQSHFCFNDEYFDQIDGCSMGSPLGPVFANIFMAEFEKNNMEQLKSLGVNIWFRYVDDIFLTTGDKKNAT